MKMMMMKIKSACVWAAVLCVVSVSCVSARRPVSNSVEVMIEMRDGVKLHTLFDFPLVHEMKNLTAVLDRSPYGESAIERIADIYLLAGFVAVRQDMRGTHKSEGNFTVWASGADDGYDTMAFIAKQPWSSGKVITVGASADGLAEFTQVQVKNPFLAAQAMVFASSVGYPIMYPGGAFRKSLIETWLNKTVPKQAPALIQQVREHEAPGPYWNRLNLTDYYGNVHFPSVMWAGWYDIFLVGNLIGFDGYRNRAAPEWRNHSRIVIDPLGHCQKGAKYFPKNLIAGRTLLPLYLTFDTFENKPPADHVLPVTFYVMGANTKTAQGNYWTSLEDFPDFKPQAWYLQGDNTLSTTAPAASAANKSTTYTYDPSNPVQSIGGNNLELSCGPLDQTPVESRQDVLVFTSAPLTAATVLTGPLIATLYVSSSANDTDFTVKLTDVYPSADGGGSHLIQDGIVRMRWREHGETPTPMTPGTVYEVEVSLWNTSYVFSEGHQIRVAVSSSNYPRYGLNPNNGLPLTQKGPNVVAKNTVYHSAQYPSHITLPTIEFAQVPPFKPLNTPAKDGEADKIAALIEGLNLDLP